MINIKLDLSSDFGPARDQAARPTCLAFAASDAHARARASTPIDYLSCEYAFYFASQRQLPTSHGKGVQTAAMLAAIAQDGQPLECHHPYQMHLKPNDALPVPPQPFPHPTFSRGATPRHGKTQDVIDCLDRRLIPVLAVNITRGFQRVRGSNSMVEYRVDDMAVGAHALVAVGHGVDAGGSKYVKIRNSWGNGWGDTGHAWLSDDYINHKMFWLATFA